MREMLFGGTLLFCCLNITEASAEVTGCKTSIILGSKSNLSKQTYTVGTAAAFFSLTLRGFWGEQLALNTRIDPVVASNRGSDTTAGVLPSLLTPGEAVNFVLQPGRSKGWAKLESVGGTVDSNPKYTLKI